MIMTTTPSIEGKKVTDYLGIVVGEAIMGANMFRDLFAGITDIIGGRSGAYEGEMAVARETALRELAEETGIKPHLVEITAETPEWHYYDLPPEMVGAIWKGKYAGQRQKWFAMTFLGSDADVAIATVHPEFKAWRWAAVETLVDMAVPFKRDLYSDVITILAR